MKFENKTTFTITQFKSDGADSFILEHTSQDVNLNECNTVHTYYRESDILDMIKFILLKDKNAESAYNVEQLKSMIMNGELKESNVKDLKSFMSAEELGDVFVSENSEQMLRSYSFIIKNETDTTQTCVLFGLENMLTKNFGSSNGVKVEMKQPNSSYLLMLLQSGFKPFTSTLIRISSKKLEQLMQILTVTGKDANGQLCQIPIITQSYFSQKKYLEQVEKGEKFSIDVTYPVNFDFSTDLNFSVLPNTELQVDICPTHNFVKSKF